MQKKIIPLHQIDENALFGNYLNGINAHELLCKLSNFGPVYLEGHDRYDTIYVDISKTNKPNLVKMFVMMSEHRPNEIEDIGHMIRFWWD